MKIITAALISITLITHFTPQAKVQNNLTEIKAALMQLVNCDKNNTCPQASNPRISYYLLGEKINQQLDKVIELQSMQGESPELVALAQQFYQYPSEFVQLKALALMAKQTPNEFSANLLLFQLGKVKDSKLAIATLTELQRYPDKSMKVDQVISQVLITGSFNAAKVLANNIRIQLNASNLEFYQSLLKKLPVKSAKANALSLNIKDFKTNN